MKPSEKSSQQNIIKIILSSISPFTLAAALVTILGMLLLLTVLAYGCIALRCTCKIQTVLYDISVDNNQYYSNR